MRALHITRQGRVVVDEVQPPIVVSRRQARLALGEERCAILDAAVDDPEIPWTLRETIRSAIEWHSDAPEIDALAWLLSVTRDEINALFQAAAEL